MYTFSPLRAVGNAGPLSHASSPSTTTRFDENPPPPHESQYNFLREKISKQTDEFMNSSAKKRGGFP